PAQYVTLFRVSIPRSLPVPCTVTSTLVPPSTEITRRTITFPASSPICSPNIVVSFRVSIPPRPALGGRCQDGAGRRVLICISCLALIWQDMSASNVPSPNRLRGHAEGGWRRRPGAEPIPGAPSAVPVADGDLLAERRAVAIGLRP